MDASATTRAEVTANGFCQRPLLPADVIASATEVFAALEVPLDRGMYRTFADDTRVRAQSVDRSLRELLGPHLSAVLPGFEPVLGTFIYKGVDGGPLDFHQDWTFTDEREYRAIIAWVPLVDVDVDNGALAIVPGSHLWSSGIRCSTKVARSATADLQPELAVRAVSVPLEAGSVLLYDAATVHGSTPNWTGSGRPAAVLILLPAGAPVVHFSELETEVVGSIVDESFFTRCEFDTHHVEETAPHRGPGPMGYADIAPWAEPVRSADIESALAATAPSTRRRWWRRRR